MPVRPFAAAAAVACAAAVATAQLSSTISYQGRLTEGTTPAGPVELRFQLYAGSSGGFSLGTAFRTLTPDADGLFSVTDLPFASLFNGADRYLEIAVRPAGSAGNFTVLSPRQPVPATPVSSFASRSGTTLDQAYANGRTVATLIGQPLTINGNAGLLVRESLDVGAPSNSDGIIELFSALSPIPTVVLQNLAGSGQISFFRSTGTPTVILESRSDSGGRLSLFDESGGGIGALIPDPDGVGGLFAVYRDGVNTAGFLVDANADASQSTRVTVAGISTIVLDASQTGDASVQLPAASVSPAELAAEAGVSHRRDYSAVAGLPAGAAVSLGDATLTAPAAGFVIATSVVVLEVPVLASAASAIREAVGIVSTPTDLPGSGGTEVRIVGPISGETRAVTVTRVFPVSAGAMTCTVRTQPLGAGGVRPTSARIESLTLVFVPTAYGTVDTN